MSTETPFWFRDNLVEQSLVASQSWLKDADIPDPLGGRDLRCNPRLVGESLRRRHEAGLPFGSPHRTPFPKPGGGFRAMTVLDPFADLIYRQLVWRVVAAVERALPAHVFNTRSTLANDSWRSDDWRPARTIHDTRISDERRSDAWEGVGHLDVQSHYATIDLNVLRHVLVSIGAPPGAVRDLVEALRVMNEYFGLERGLPIGPEASAPLGTVVLLPLDRILASCATATFRWMDDVTTFVHSEQQFWDLLDAIRIQLTNSGQGLNLSKCRYESLRQPDEDAYDVTASMIDGELGAGGDESAAGDHLGDAAERGEATSVPAWLGQLRRDKDPSGVSTLLCEPRLIERFPKQSAKYFDAFRSSIADWDPIVGFELADTTRENSAAQLHLVRLLRRHHIGKRTGEDLFSKGHATSRSHFAPLANELLGAAGRSQESTIKRRRRALELARELSDLNARRVLMLALRDGSLDRSGKTAIRHLVKADPDLRPAAELVGAV